MHVAIATSLASLPPDESALLAALRQIGISARPEIWSATATDWSQFDAVVVRSCWDYHLRVDEFRQWIDHLQQRNIVVLNSPRLIGWNIDKGYLRELSNGGIATPETVWLALGKSVEVSDVCRAHKWPSAVVKPLISASAYGTERRTKGIVHGPLMIQEYLPEIETEGEWSLMYFHGVFSHAVRKRATCGDFRVQSDFGGTTELATPPRNFLNVAHKALELVPGRSVFARVDMVERDSSALLMELELIEPELFLILASQAAHGLALAIEAAI